MQPQLYCWLLITGVIISVSSSELFPEKVAHSPRLGKRSTTEPEFEQPIPRNVVPNSYTLELQPSILEGNFIGQVKINISCHAPTDTIVLHADNDLKVQTVGSTVQSIGLWTGSSGSGTFKQIESSHHYERIYIKYSPHNVEILDLIRDSDKNWIEIKLKEKLKLGFMYEFNLKFSGDISAEEVSGLYRLNYTDSASNEERWFVIASMDERNARKVFPCFDDPSFKAVFQLNMVLPDSLKAMSTMPLESTEAIENKGGWKIEHFAPTPPMAAQSLGVVIFDPTHIVLLTSEKVNDVTISGYGQTTSKNSFQSHMDFVVSRFRMLQEFLGTNFPLPELKLFVIPSAKEKFCNKDFWGVISFSEVWLEQEHLFQFMPLGFLPRQWIGHMATPDTQTEPVGDGLRMFLSFNALADILQTPEYLEDIIHMSALMAYDLYDSINQHLNPWMNTFRISWVWTMLNDTLTEDTFKLGIQNFMREKAFKTFSEYEVFKALDDQAWLDGVLPLHISVQHIAKSWIDEKLFPIVTITRNYEQNFASVQQHPFLPERRRNQTQQMKDHLFWVPITYITAENLDISSIKLATWMKEKQKVINNLPDEHTFIIVNPDHAGLFWVNYDHTNWHLLSQYLLRSATDKSLNKIPGETRSKLLHDALQLAMARELDFPTALNLTLFMRYERNLNTWLVFHSIMEGMSRMLFDTPVLDKFLAYCNYLVVPMYKHVQNWELKGYFSEAIVDDIKFLAADTGYEPAMSKAKTEFRLVLGNNSMSYSRYACSIFRWSDGDWELALQYILTTVPTNETSNNDFLDLLRCTRKPENINRILYLVFVDNRYVFSDKDVKDILHSIYDYETLLIFMSEYWNEVKSRLGNKPELWNMLFREATEDIKTEEELRLVKKLYEEHRNELNSAKEIVEGSLTQIQANLNGKYKFVKEIDMWMNIHLPSLSTV